MSASAEVLYDDNLLRSICELGDQQFLYSARFASARLRTFATAVIHARFPHCPLPPRLQSHLNKVAIHESFMAGKMQGMPLLCAEGKPQAIISDSVVVDHAVVRSTYMKLIEMGAASPVLVCEACPMARMQQAVLTVAMIRDEGINGPFVIVVPQCEPWQQVFATLAPSIPLIVNEGTPSERRNRIASLPPAAPGGYRDFVFLSSYALALKDNSTGRHLHSHIKSLGPKVVIFDQGHVHLRRGWRDNLPGHAHYRDLSPSQALFRNLSCNITFVLAEHASACAFSDAEVRWLLSILLPFVYELPLTDECIAHFSQTLRDFGIGRREATQRIDTLVNTLHRQVFEQSHRIKFVPQTNM